MRTSESTAEIGAALVRVQELIQNPSKSQDVRAGQKTYSFAPLPEILDDLRAHLHLNGLAIVQETATYEGNVGVTTRLFHTSGEWIEFGPLIMPPANDAQAVGSAITYARRYAVCAALSVAAEADDDGQAATPRKKSGAGKGRSQATGEGAGNAPPAPDSTSGPEQEPSSTTTRDAPASGLEPYSPASAPVEPKAAAGDDAPAAAAGDHEAVWIDSPTMSKFEVCFVEKCVLHPPRKKKVPA
jgi:hypothetical protein